MMIFKGEINIKNAHLNTENKVTSTNYWLMQTKEAASVEE